MSFKSTHTQLTWREYKDVEVSGTFWKYHQRKDEGFYNMTKAMKVFPSWACTRRTWNAGERQKLGILSTIPALWWKSQSMRWKIEWVDRCHPRGFETKRRETLVDRFLTSGLYSFPYFLGCWWVLSSFYEFRNRRHLSRLCRRTVKAK